MVIPKPSNLEINSTLANININGLSGLLNIDTTAGNVDITNFNGQLEIDSVDTPGILILLSCKTGYPHKYQFNKI